jgi:hypothetical protein
MAATLTVRTPSVRPHPFEQLVFFDDMTTVSHQHHECVESFGREGNDLLAFGQDPLGDVQVKRTELVGFAVLVLLRHINLWRRCSEPELVPRLANDYRKFSIIIRSDSP